MSTTEEISKENYDEGLIDKEENKIESDIEKYPDINEKQSNVQTIDKNGENFANDVINLMKPKRCCFVELNKGVSYFNLCTYYLVQFSYVCAFTFIDACQDYLLESPDYYAIKKDQVGKINGDILLFDTLYLIAFIYIYGSFHDIFGRKILVVYGFLSMGLSLFLHPLAGNIYPNLILVRLIFSNGICAVTTQPLLADYVNYKTKGFGGGIAAVVSGLGAIFAALFLLKLQVYMDIKYVYWITAGFCVIVAIICMFGVKNIETRANSEPNVCRKFADLYKKLKDGFIEVRHNLPLGIGIATNALSRINTLLITLFLVMWIKQHDFTEAESINLGHKISGIGNSVGLVSALLFGFLFEKRKISNFLLLTNAFIIIGYVLFFLNTDPQNWIATVSISISCFGFYGLLTMGYVMVNQYCGHKARGSVMGINCLFGAIAILVLAQGGGYAFDKVDKAAPFVGAAILSFILFIVILFCRKQLDEAKPQGCPVNHSKLAMSGENAKLADAEKEEPVASQ